MTVSVETEPDRDNVTAITRLQVEAHGIGGLGYVRLLNFDSGKSEVGVGARGTLADPEVTAWFDPNTAAQLADVIGAIADWPAEALACLAAAIRQSAAAAEGVRG